MPCYKPHNAWRSNVPNENGKFELLFNVDPSLQSSLQLEQVPCRKCIGCRLDYSKQWALRCVHESKLHEQNAFITLTYDDDHLPNDYSVNKREWQLFLKKLRQELSYQNIKIRFFMAAEYGETTWRPHYHALIFGWYPPDHDLTPIAKNSNGDYIYSSEMLARIWGKGKVDVGDVTYESAAYVARYIKKKITGDLAEEHYKQVHPTTTDIVQLEPEFCLQSRRPGIGGDFYRKYKEDFRKGYITHNGTRHNLSRFYNKQFEKEDPERYETLKNQKSEFAKEFMHTDEALPKRQKVKETIKLRQTQKLIRDKQ